MNSACQGKFYMSNYTQNYADTSQVVSRPGAKENGRFVQESFVLRYVGEVPQMRLHVCVFHHIRPFF